MTAIPCEQNYSLGERLSTSIITQHTSETFPADLKRTYNNRPSLQRLDSTHMPFSLNNLVYKDLSEVVSPSQGDLTPVPAVNQSILIIERKAATCPNESFDMPVKEVQERPKLKKMGSILKSKSLKLDTKETEHKEDKSTEEEKRVDAKGIEILNGGKEHKATFKHKIHTVKLVDNWKEFNKNKKKKYEVCNDKCSIF